MLGAVVLFLNFAEAFTSICNNKSNCLQWMEITLEGQDPCKAPPTCMTAAVACDVLKDSCSKEAEGLCKLVKGIKEKDLLCGWKETKVEKNMEGEEAKEVAKKREEAERASAEAKRRASEARKRAAEAERREEAKRAAKAREEAEAKRAAKAREEAEAKRRAAEAKRARARAEAERAARAREEAETAARARAEAERVARAREEAETAARARAEAERVARAREEAETKRRAAEAKRARARAEAERVARAREEAETAARARAEAERVAAEAKRRASEARKREEDAKRAAKARADAEAKRRAAEARKREEDAKRAAKARADAEAKRRAAEAKRREEIERAAKGKGEDPKEEEGKDSKEEGEKGEDSKEEEEAGFLAGLSLMELLLSVGMMVLAVVCLCCSCHLLKRIVKRRMAIPGPFSVPQLKSANCLAHLWHSTKLTFQQRRLTSYLRRVDDLLAADPANILYVHQHNTELLDNVLIKLEGPIPGLFMGGGPGLDIKGHRTAEEEEAREEESVVDEAASRGEPSVAIQLEGPKGITGFSNPNSTLERSTSVLFKKEGSKK